MVTFKVHLPPDKPPVGRNRFAIRAALKMWKWESSLVETRTFQSNRKVGTFKEPKFEQG
jgi:hypothetical protein